MELEIYGKQQCQEACSIWGNVGSFNFVSIRSEPGLIGLGRQLLLITSQGCRICKLQHFIIQHARVYDCETMTAVELVMISH